MLNDPSRINGMKSPIAPRLTRRGKRRVNIRKLNLMIFKKTIRIRPSATNRDTLINLRRATNVEITLKKWERWFTCRFQQYFQLVSGTIFCHLFNVHETNSHRLNYIQLSHQYPKLLPLNLKIWEHINHLSSFVLSSVHSFIHSFIHSAVCLTIGP